MKADRAMHLRRGSGWCAGRTHPAARPASDGIGKQSNKYLRQLLMPGATAVLRYSLRGGSNPSLWIAGPLSRRPAKVLAGALANKNGEDRLAGSDAW